jgi:acetyltransferase-like isoleucine patch superfamily enzyme
VSGAPRAGADGTDVPPDSVVMGNPARVVKRLERASSPGVEAPAPQR